LRHRIFAASVLTAIALTLSGCATGEPKPYTELYFSESPTAASADQNPGLLLLEDPEKLKEELEERQERESEARLAREAAIQRAIASRDVVVGMSADDVARIWGEPHDVDYAGDDGSPHQRWTYSEGWTSRYGVAPQRVLYFENGRVAGWETQ
jgi:hypothetical protein